MSKRFPFRTAIAGLTAVAMVAPVITPPNASILAAAVAQAQEAVAVTGPDSLGIKTSGTFTATVPGATDGKVQFFLDGVLVATKDVNAQGTATASITPKSYGDHTLVTRYVTTVDGTEYNVNPDGEKKFTTPFPTKYELNDAGRTGVDLDTYGDFQLNNQSGSLDSPAELQPGETYTVSGRMTTERSGGGSLFRPDEYGRLYEVGFNPPVESKYVEGSAVKYITGTTNPDTNMFVRTRANQNGVTTTQSGTGVYGPDWGKNSYSRLWPTVNTGYVGLQSSRSYDTSKGDRWEIAAQFTAPDIPGIHIPEYAAFKYRNNLHVLLPMNEAAFRIAPKELPDRNELPAAQDVTVSLDADQTLVAQRAGKIIAHVSPKDAAGKVTFETENGTATADVVDGVATLDNVTFQTEGTKNVKLTFEPANALWKTSTSEGTVEVTGVTTTSLTVEPDTQRVYPNDTFSVDVNVAPDDATGTLTIMDGSNEIAREENATGTVTFDNLKLSEPGKKTLKAVFTADPASTFGNSEKEFTVNVAQKTATKLEAPAETSTTQDVPLKATVSPAAAGTVEFFDGEDSLGTAKVSNGTATLTRKLDQIKTYSVTAKFTPEDATLFDGSTSAAKNIEVKSPAVNTTATYTGDTEGKPNQEVALKAEVKDADNQPVNGGTVKFYANNITTYAANVPVVNGVAEASYKFSSAGVRDVYAIYTPADTNAYNASQPSVKQTIAIKDEAKTILTASNSTPIIGEKVTLTARVTPAQAAGQVQFKDGDTVLATVDLTGSNNQATYEYTPENTDEKTITAVYVPAGNSNYTAGEAASVTITPKAAEETTLNVTANPDSGTTEDDITLTATVPAGAKGKVQFYNNGEKLGDEQTVSNGTATLSTNLPEGDNKITAEFTSDNENAFTNATVAEADAATVTIAKAPTAPTVTVTALTEEKTTDDDITLTAKVDPASAGTVEFFNGDTKIDGTVDYDPATGEATLTTKLAEGDYTITAKFTPADDNTTAKEATSAPAEKFTVVTKTVNTPTSTPSPTTASTGPSTSSESTTPTTSTEAQPSSTQAKPTTSGETTTPVTSTEAQPSSTQAKPTTSGETTTPVETTTTPVETTTTPVETTTETTTSTSGAAQPSTSPVETSTSGEATTTETQPSTSVETTTPVTTTSAETTTTSVTTTETQPSTSAQAKPTTSGAAQPTTSTETQPSTSVETTPVTTTTSVETTTTSVTTTETQPSTSGETTTPVTTTTSESKPSTTTTTTSSESKPSTTTTTTQAQPGTKQKDIYAPQAVQDAPQITEGEALPAPSKVIANVTTLPGGTVLRWTTVPTKAQPTGEISVTYPDGSVDMVEVTFKDIQAANTTDGTSSNGSSQSSEGSSLSRPTIIGISITAAVALLGLLGFGLANNQQFKDFLYTQFGIRL